MALILKRMYQLYSDANEYSDPRVMQYWIVGRPVQIIAIMVGYIYIVKKLGPKLMENREPFDIRKLMMVYDVLQIVLNAYVVKEGLMLIPTFKSWTCEPIDYSESPVAMRLVRAGYIYFLLKILDLFDTVFFVLRKSYRQISFLHVYHHTGMVGGMWYAITYFCGGQGTWVPVVNSFVHLCMFTYYFLAAYNPSWKQNVTIKKLITQLQLVQFLFFIIMYTNTLINKNCSYPKIASALFVPQNFFMFFLFADFYLKTYVYKKNN